MGPFLARGLVAGARPMAETGLTSLLQRPSRSGCRGRCALAQSTAEAGLASPAEQRARGTLWARHRASGADDGVVHQVSSMYVGLHYLLHENE
jgi:hypothetical protein